MCLTLIRPLSKKMLWQSNRLELPSRQPGQAVTQFFKIHRFQKQEMAKVLNIYPCLIGHLTSQKEIRLSKRLVSNKTSLFSLRPIPSRILGLERSCQPLTSCRYKLWVEQLQRILARSLLSRQIFLNDSVRCRLIRQFNQEESAITTKM